jgi:metal-dependent HD superfamily phosphatase/phosphodiesterase
VQHDRLRREQPGDAVHVEHVELVEAEARPLAHFAEIALLHAAGVKRIEVVDPDHLVATVAERLNEVRADEASRAGEQHPCHWPSCPRK